MSATNCVRLEPSPPTTQMRRPCVHFPIYTHTHIYAHSSSQSHTHKQHAELRCTAAAQYTITNNFHQFCFHMLLYYHLVCVASSLCNLSLFRFFVLNLETVSTVPEIWNCKTVSFIQTIFLLPPPFCECVCVSVRLLYEVLMSLLSAITHTHSLALQFERFFNGAFRLAQLTLELSSAVLYLPPPFAHSLYLFLSLSLAHTLKLPFLVVLAEMRRNCS